MTILASGQLQTTQSTIFEADGANIFSSADFIIEKITFFNTNAAQQTARLFIKKRNGTARQLRQFQMLENEGGEYLEPGEFLDLDNGDALQALTTTASAVDFVVFGTRT